MKLVLILFCSTLLFSQHSLKPSPFIHRIESNLPTNFSELRMDAFESFKDKKDHSFFENLHWQNLGPYVMGGRITDIAVPKDEFFTFYIAAASGGVWKTENNGTSWAPIFENESSITIGDIAVSDSDPNTIWVGTGENNSLRSSFAGTGVFKSTNGGKTWENMGLHDSHHIGRIIIHPTNPNIVYVASIGHLYSSNNERGVFKTTDAGKTWTKILYIDEHTGVIDISFAPDNTNILYAAAWERNRKAWNFVESGVNSGIYKSSNAGETWTKQTKGFPNDQFVGRIGFGTSKSAPNVVYALLDNQKMKGVAKESDKARMANTSNNVVDSVITGIELYRSDNYGDSWKLVSEDFDNTKMYSVYGYFFGNMAVDPNNVDVVYALGIQMAKSTNGGKNWTYPTENSNVHGDHHAIWINPHNSNHVLNGNDGGLDMSFDASATWQSVQNLPITQFYAITVDHEKPYNIYGGTQDNGSWVGPSNRPAGGGDIMGIMDDFRWHFISGGDGFYVQVDPTNSNITYSESQWGWIGRNDYGKRTSIKPKPKSKSEKYRFNWSSPILLSQHNHLTIYFGGNKLFKSLNQGNDWLEVSPDLSNQDSTRVGDVTFGTITTIAESPFNPNVLYVGTDDGNVWVTKNGGVNWTQIDQTIPDLWVSRVVASKYEEGTAYASVTGYREDDFTPHVFRTTNFGETWEALSADLPIEPVNVIREDEWNKNILYLGTDLGVYASFNAGKNWENLSTNLPTIAVHDLVQHPREGDLVIGTHGRGVYKLKASYLSALTDSVRKAAYYIYENEPVTYSYNMNIEQTFTLGKATSVRVDILDEKKKVYKKLQDGSLKAGFHSVSWDGLKNNPKHKWDRVDKKAFYIRFKIGSKTIIQPINWRD